MGVVSTRGEGDLPVGRDAVGASCGLGCRLIGCLLGDERFFDRRCGSSVIGSLHGRSAYIADGLFSLSPAFGGLLLSSLATSSSTPLPHHRIRVLPLQPLLASRPTLRRESPQVARVQQEKSKAIAERAFVASPQPPIRKLELLDSEFRGHALHERQEMLVARS